MYTRAVAAVVASLLIATALIVATMQAASVA